jgi:UDP-N-acetyl-D-glucosamine dehydrogenase
MENRPALERIAGEDGERVKYMTDYKSQLLAKFESHDARIGIIGLGYVGLPLAVAFAESGFHVTGIDLDSRKIDALNRGESYVEDVPAATVAALAERGLLTATTDYAALAVCDAVSICVPTPLGKTGDPDISYIVSASNEVARHLHPGMVVVLESTTYPGTTTEVLLPLLEGNGQNLRAGEDFFLAFSPERVDPGREDWTTHTTPKVIGGVTPACLQVAMAFYSSAIQTLVPVSSTEAAEMVKLLENTFRAVNIGLVNEVLLMADKLGLDVWEVIDAAATKPFGFMKFTPGPGLGGHCIPIDPLYLSWKLKTLNYNARFIELASEVNTNMPRYWVQKVQDALNDAGKPVKGSRILVLGVAYKKNISDVRESPSLDIIHLLNEKGARVSYHDPHVPAFHHEGMEMASVTDLDAALAASDCVVIATDHDEYDWARIGQQAPLIVDTRRALRPVAAPAGAA